MFQSLSRRVSGKSVVFVAASLSLALMVVPASAQEVDDQIEEITVTGTQIKGANISDALAISVISAEEIEMFGVESGEELMDLIPENGQNFLNEADTAGGVNAARGDVGAFNLRNMGTGNTLVLLNGRRLVNSATYQTEEVGGSFVPVNTVNSNHIPVFGVERLEVLRDGASAIYGADAVAGVVNTVLKDDFEGFTLRARYTDYDNVPRDDQALALEWGTSLNGGATHVGVFARYYQRDPVNAQDDPRWADRDFRYRFDDSSPYSEASGSTIFRNDSANSLYGQYDIVTNINPSSDRDRYGLIGNDVTDSSGEFETFPIGDERCEYPINQYICGGVDGQGTYRYNLNEVSDLTSEMDRTTVYAYLNHEMENGVEFFADGYYYRSTTERLLYPTTALSASILRVGAENYYNPLGPCTLPDGSPNPNRLPDSIIGTDVPCSGLELRIDNYRFAETPRTVNNDGDSYRLLAGFRGSAGDWDWETAFVTSQATREETTNNRLSNTLITEALFDPTPAAYNPFSGGVDSNVEQAYIDVFRNGKTTLNMWDVKVSNANLFEMPAGPVGLLVGAEFRREKFRDDRDPRLDGTIRFTDFEGDTYPLSSDVVNSSPTPDNSGSRFTESFFAELQLPLHETLDVQLAVRYEDFDDVGDTTVGKVAFGWRPIDLALLRGSYSTAFRAPNLITINETFTARSNTRDDWVCFYGVDQGTVPDDTFSDCDYSMQRQATGSKDLESEESDNWSVGIVLTPIENLMITVDYWGIEKDDTIGLFGEENHVLVDLVTRLDAGTADCANVQGNPVVTRDDPTTDPDEAAGFLAAGLCPVGRVTNIADTYTNLDTRKIEGHDIGVYYDIDTSFGAFAFRYNGTFYDTYEQEATSGITAALVAAKEANPDIIYPIAGIGDLISRNGNQDARHSAALSWQQGNWGAGMTAYRIDDFYQELSNGDRFDIPSMTTYDATLDYSFDVSDTETRIRLGARNFTDERAPIYDSSYGFSSDAHRDYGRIYYVDLRLRF